MSRWEIAVAVALGAVVLLVGFVLGELRLAGGVVLALVLGHLATKSVAVLMRSQWDPQSWHPEAVGLIERTIFVGSIVAALPEGIVAWLVLKVAAGLGSASRPEYNRLLIGTGLSLVFGVAGGIFAVPAWHQGARVPDAVLWLVPIGLWALVWARARWAYPREPFAEWVVGPRKALGDWWAARKGPPGGGTRAGSPTL